MAENKGLFGRLREAISPSSKVEERHFDPAFHYPWTPTQSGVALTKDGALAVSAVYACVNKISSTIASLDLNLYRIEGSKKTSVPSHPAFILCDSEPNPYYTAFQFWQFIVSDALMHGSGYAIIDRDENGRPKSLVLASPNSIKARDLNGRRIYMYEGSDDPLYNEDVLAIECFRGVSPIQEHIENIGLGYAAQQYGASFFGSGGNMSGVLMTDKQLSEDQYRRLSSTWQSKYHGINSSHATAILEAGLKYERVGIPPDQSQFLGVRKYQVEEICRIFNVPTGMVQVGDQKYSNVEQQDLFFAKHTIHPWLVSIEQEMNRKLLLPAERKEHRFKFDMMTLLRGDMSARATYYHTLLSDGVLTINEVRGLENRNAIEGGDQALVQVNQLPLTSMEAYAKSITNNNGESVDVKESQNQEE